MRSPETRRRLVDAGEARAELDDRIRRIFGGTVFETVAFPGGPFDTGRGRPKPIVLAYDGVAIGATVERVPESIDRIHARKGAEGSALRALRNNLAFAVAVAGRKEEMRRKAVRRLAPRALKKPKRLVDPAEHRQTRIRELEARSEQELAITIRQCYRHVFYPSRDRVGAGNVDLAHSAIDVHSTSDQPGAGQRQIVRALRDLRKLRLPARYGVAASMQTVGVRPRSQSAFICRRLGRSGAGRLRIKLVE